MIEFLRGKIVHTKGETVTIEVGDVGYLVYCPNPFIFPLQEATTIYTYQYVREDVIRLYGFASRKERQLFEQLLQVSGIGPKGALAILAAGSPMQVAEAVENEDEKFLMKFPGVGKKTARQMILDLKGKLLEALQDSSSDTSPVTPQAVADNSVLEEALEALRALGYSEKEIKKVKPKLQEENLSAEEYVKKALQLMLS